MKINLCLLSILLLAITITNFSCNVASANGINTKMAVTDTAIINLSRQASVKILVYDTNNKLMEEGTGFFLNDNMTIVTCFHVIGSYKVTKTATGVNVSWVSSKSIKCVTYNNDTIGLTWVLTRKNENDVNFLEHDFAVLKLDKKSIHPIRWLNLSKDSKIYAGEEIYFSGYPLNLPLLSNNGTVSGIGEDNIFLQAPSNNGNSGGALLDSKGNVIGIIDFKALQLSMDFEKYMYAIEHADGEVGFYQGGLELSGNQFNYKLIRTLNDNLNTGIGGAKNVTYFKEYLR